MDSVGGPPLRESHEGLPDAPALGRWLDRYVGHPGPRTAGEVGAGGEVDEAVRRSIGRSAL